MGCVMCEQCQELEARLSGQSGRLLMSSSLERSTDPSSNDCTTIVHLRAQLQEQVVEVTGELCLDVVTVRIDSLFHIFVLL